MGFPGGSDIKDSACSAGDLGSIPGSGRSPGEGNTCSSILAWRISWTEELGGLQSLELQRAGVTKTHFPGISKLSSVKGLINLLGFADQMVSVAMT